MTRGALSAGLFAAALTAAVLDGGLRGQTPERGVLRYGMTEATIESASPNDARAASLVWARGIADAMGGLYSGASAEVYPTAASAAAAINGGQVDVMAMSTLEFLSIEKSMNATPSMVWELAGDVLVDYVLLARTRGGARLPDVSGKSLAVLATNRPWALSDMWADVMLADVGVPQGERAFASVKAITKKGHAAMAVFFGQADFAIESLTAFDTAVELNPQIGRELTVLARSPQFVPGLVSLNNAMGPNVQRQYVDKASRLHELGRFKQAFVILRVTRIVPWNPQYLESARALVERHRALRARR